MAIRLSSMFRVYDVGFEVYPRLSGLLWESCNSNTLAVKGSGYLVDVTGGAVTITLPLYPQPDDQVGISDYTGLFSTTNCVVNRNGKPIMGVDDNFTCNIDNMTVWFAYIDTTEGWRIISR